MTSTCLLPALQSVFLHSDILKCAFPAGLLFPEVPSTAGLGVQRSPESSSQNNSGCRSRATSGLGKPPQPTGYPHLKSSMRVLGKAASSGLEVNFSDNKPLLSKSGHIQRHNAAVQLYQQMVNQLNLQRLPCTSIPVSPLDKGSQCPRAVLTDFRKGTQTTTVSSAGLWWCKPHGMVLVRTFCKGCGLFSLSHILAL